MDVRAILEDAYQKSLSHEALNDDNPDPLLVARDKPDDEALICALFSYGGFRKIVAFLKSLPFELLNESDKEIAKTLDRYYRFQTREDLIAIFQGFARLRRENIELKEIFESTYRSDGMLSALNSLIGTVRDAIGRDSQGVQFFANRTFDINKLTGVSANKRWMMFLRWMVRTNTPDLGRWSAKESDLIAPLDTHTFNMGRKLGFITRKAADLKSAIELTEAFKKFDPVDPLKYDFALYRLGQSGTI